MFNTPKNMNIQIKKAFYLRVEGLLELPELPTSSTLSDFDLKMISTFVNTCSLQYKLLGEFKRYIKQKNTDQDIDKSVDTINLEEKYKKHVGKSRLSQTPRARGGNNWFFIRKALCTYSRNKCILII